ncbi:MAG: hypothetical protein WB615_01850 [Candidatus Tumulicola sp.]
MTYADESAALDAEILGVIDDWRHNRRMLADDRFDALALRAFDYQFRYNAPYARYCVRLGFSSASTAASWHDIPAVPAAAFKEAVLATFDSSTAALTFETSGTTAGRPGRHYFETPALYEAALLAAFDRFVLPDGARLRYLNLVPNPAERPQSSLGYMMRHVSRHRAAGATGWYLRGDRLAVEDFVADAQSAIHEGSPACIAATAFALANLLDALEQRNVLLPLPSGSRMMETGGFKGRARVVEREELYRRAGRLFGLPPQAVLAEYGMTELTSQYYDDALLRNDDGPVDARRKFAPPWLRARVVAPDGSAVCNGTVGSLVHVDLANRSSCVAVATEDLGVQFGDNGGLVLIGRERGAALRGCSLDAESLRPLRDAGAPASG